jgi:rhodanese-related sulfurtransferase
MDEGRFSISAGELYQRLGSASAPVVIDVRRAPAFDQDNRMIVGAIRCLPHEVAARTLDLGHAGQVIVYCVHGHEVSQSAAETLRGLGIEARYLAGGIAAWIEQGLPIRHEAGVAGGKWNSAEA